MARDGGIEATVGSETCWVSLAEIRDERSKVLLLFGESETLGVGEAEGND